MTILTSISSTFRFVLYTATKVPTRTHSFHGFSYGRHSKYENTNSVSPQELTVATNHLLSLNSFLFSHPYGPNQPFQLWHIPTLFFYAPCFPDLLNFLPFPKHILLYSVARVGSSTLKKHILLINAKSLIFLMSNLNVTFSLTLVELSLFCALVVLCLYLKHYFLPGVIVMCM